MMNFFYIMCSSFATSVRIMNNKLIALIILCVASFASAQSSPSAGASTPQEHRGFYSNMSFGFAYNWYDNSREDVLDYNSRYDMDHYEFSGFTFPMSEFKFGIAFENLVAFHLDFNIGFFSGTLDFSNEKRTSICTSDGVCAEVRQTEKERDSESSDANSLRTYFGFGTTLYPFRDVNSPLNGFFVGGSVGYTLFVTLSDGIGEEISGNGGFGFELEIGKEWWISDHVSFGFGFGFAHTSIAWKVNDSHKSDNVLSLSFRMTRG